MVEEAEQGKSAHTLHDITLIIKITVRVCQFIFPHEGRDGRRGGHRSDGGGLTHEVGRNSLSYVF